MPSLSQIVLCGVDYNAEHTDTRCSAEVKELSSFGLLAGIHNDCIEHPSLLTGTFVVISTGLWFCSTNLCSAL